MRARIALLAGALALAGGAAAAAGKGSFEAHSAKARDLYGKGDLEGAAAEFQIGRAHV